MTGSGVSKPPRAGTQQDEDASRFFAYGMLCATGRAGSRDLVAAHKWFNLAALRGNAEAIRWRREIAAEMSGEEIAAAQRAARLADPGIVNGGSGCGAAATAPISSQLETFRSSPAD